MLEDSSIHINSHWDGHSSRDGNSHSDSDHYTACDANTFANSNTDVDLNSFDGRVPKHLDADAGSNRE